MASPSIEKKKRLSTLDVLARWRVLIGRDALTFALSVACSKSSRQMKSVRSPT